MADQVARHTKRGRKKVYLCDAIVELERGNRYVCGRHTKNKSGRCTQHQKVEVQDGR